MIAKAWIVGIGGEGPDTLSQPILERIRKAGFLVGGERHLSWFPERKGEKLVLGSNMKEAADRVISALGEGKEVVVLASGDPLFYGIGSFLIKRIGKERVEVVPSVSAMQIAFARAGESWQGAALGSLSARPVENLLPALEDKKLIGLFTDETNTPAAIARFLLDRGESGWTLWVCENLGSAEERVVETDLFKAAEEKFAPLNVVILKKKEEGGLSLPGAVRWSGLIGIPDDLFVCRKPKAGLITKKEVRVISLSELNLRPDSVVWDIGAGSGSVSVETGRLAPSGRVFAIEKNREDYELIQTNLDRFQVINVRAVCGRAPEGLETFSSPDAIFIGGSGGEMGEILEICAARLRPEGRIVANLITMENSHLFARFFEGKPWEVSYTLVQISRSKPILEMVRYEALNPVTVAVAKRRTE